MKKIQYILEWIVLIGILITLIYKCSVFWALLLILKVINYSYRSYHNKKKYYKLYGEIKYKRLDYQALYWISIISFIQLFFLIINFNIFMNYSFDLIFVLFIYGLDLIMFFYYSKIKLIIFSKGIYYKKKVIKLNHIKGYLVVKNYEGNYEFYKNGSKKVLTLSRDEMDFLQESIKI